MPLPAAAATRQLKHRRQIEVQVHLRSDGLWEADALLTDVKTRDTLLGGVVRPAGAPIHEMLLRVVVDERLQIVAAGSQTLGMPYPGECDRFVGAPVDAAAHADAPDPYARLAGLNLLNDFRRALRDRVGGAQGCTHLTELAQVLPTAVVQAMAGEVIDTRGHGAARPFQIGRCHALREDREVVRLHHPRWWRPAAAQAAEGRTPAALAAEAAVAPSPRQPHESSAAQHRGFTRSGGAASAAPHDATPTEE